MKPRYVLAVLLLAALGFTAWQLIEWRNRPPEVQFVRAVQENLTSSVSTNGRVEPAEWAQARADSAGAVTRILVRLNQQVAAGAPLVELDTAPARAQLEAADARIAAAQADLALFDSGGRPADRAAIDAEIANTRVLLQQAQNDLATEQRLESKQVSTRAKVDAVQQRVDQLQRQIASLEERRGALVTPTDSQAAQARLQEAQAARKQAQLDIERSTVRAPLAGTIYEFDLKPGAYLNAGDAVATIGRLERVRVNVFVDEPDLGRVALGKPVTITSDAVPGRQWTGAVDRLPVRIEALGTRQVGEVLCMIDNPNRDLLPGTNVTAVILSETAENAIAVPKEALFRANNQTGVYLLAGDHLEWRAVTQGVSNVTYTQVFELQAGDAVALPSELSFTSGMLVRPLLP